MHRITTIIVLLSMSLIAFGQTNEQILSLDGNWEIVFDHENMGQREKWYQTEKFDEQPKRQITVPSAWELIEQDYEGVAFYKKSFNVPADWKDKVMRLQFDAVNYIAEVWLNGEVIGNHEGGFTPFEFRVDEIIKPGEENTLILRVEGPIIMSDKVVNGIGRLETPQWRGGITGGIWQSVRLVNSGEVYVKDVFVESDITKRKSTFHITLDHAGLANVEVNISLNAKGKGGDSFEVEKKVNLHPGINSFDWELAMPNAKLWSPESPYLYTANLKVNLNNQLSDEWSERFGIREFTIKDKDFYLNGKRIYVKATFFEGLYPTGIAYPDSKEMAMKEIQLAKDAGFNMIRPWRRPPVPFWLDLADEMGVLIVASPVLECMTLPLSTPYLAERVEHEVRASVLRDRNHPSIVQWELFNELHRPVLKQLMHPMAMVTRDLDPTRLILDESGGWAYGANIYLPNQYEPVKFNDIHNYPGPFINTPRFEGYLSIGLTDEEKSSLGLRGTTPGRNVVPGLMSFVSELGYGSLPNLTTANKHFKEKGNELTPAYRYHARLAKKQREMLDESGFGDMYPDMEKFYLEQQKIHGAANKRMIEAVRLNPRIDGYCVHALSAGDWIIGAGLIDLWREPKKAAYEATKAANQPRILVIEPSARNIYASEELTFKVHGVNDLENVSGQLNIELRTEDGESVQRFEENVKLKSGISKIFEKAIATDQLRGNYQITASLKENNENVITENSFDLTVFEEVAVSSETEVAVIDSEGKLSNYLKGKGYRVVDFTESLKKDVPVLLTTKKTQSLPLYKLLAFLKKGGTVIYVEGAVDDIGNDNNVFPFTATATPSVGLWTCMSHLVPEHPLFESMPEGMMRDAYENIYPRRTLRNIQMEEKFSLNPLVTTIGFDWFSADHKLHYLGPGESWWGSDVAEISLGKGKLIISQFRIVENLGTDPLADRLLFNFIKRGYK